MLQPARLRLRKVPARRDTPAARFTGRAARWGRLAEEVPSETLRCAECGAARGLELSLWLKKW